MTRRLVKTPGRVRHGRNCPSYPNGPLGRCLCGLAVQAPRNTGTYQHRILIGVPTLGTVRIEWHNAMNGLVVPTNWSNSYQTPIGFLVDDAQNIIAHEALSKGFEWVLFIEDDVIPPPDLFLRLVPYLESKDVPVVSGLYRLKGASGEPMVYRGRGTGAFKAWKPGDKVWCDGVPTGCLLLHCSLLKALAKTAEDYTLRSNGQGMTLKRIFETPRKVFADAALGTYQKLVGTSDLAFCDRLLADDRALLKAAGWSSRRQYPFLVDTAIRCGHIDRNTGAVY